MTVTESHPTVADLLARIDVLATNLHMSVETSDSGWECTDAQMDDLIPGVADAWELIVSFTEGRRDSIGMAGTATELYDVLTTTLPRLIEEGPHDDMDAELWVFLPALMFVADWGNLRPVVAA